MAASAFAQPGPPPPPLPPEGARGTESAPFSGDADLEPQVTVIKRAEETHEEVRIGGVLRFVRVTPTHGKPYYLVPNINGGPMIRRESLDTSVSVPMWVLRSW